MGFIVGSLRFKCILVYPHHSHRMLQENANFGLFLAFCRLIQIYNVILKAEERKCLRIG